MLVPQINASNSCILELLVLTSTVMWLKCEMVVYSALKLQRTLDLCNILYFLQC